MLTEVVGKSPASILALVLTTAHLVAFASGMGTLVQLPTALLFYALCPGVLIFEVITLEELLAQVGLVVGFSLAFNSVVATVLLYLGVFSPLNGVVVVATVTLVALGLLHARPAPQALLSS